MGSEIDGAQAGRDGQQPPSAPIALECNAPNHQTTTSGAGAQRNQPDNKLDRDLVRWTRVVGVFTGLLFIAAILQFCAMRGQLIAMQRQLAEMTVQSSITEAQLRPRLSLSIHTGGELKGATNQGSPDVDARLVTPVWKNFGVVDPEGLVGWVRVQPFPGSGFLEYEKRGAALSQGSAIATPLDQTDKGTFEQYSVMVEGAYTRAVLTGTAQVIVWGGIQYRDPFPESPIHHFIWCRVLMLTVVDGVRKAAWFPYSDDCNKAD